MQIGLFSHSKSRKFLHENRKRKSLSSLKYDVLQRVIVIFVFSRFFRVILCIQFLRINILISLRRTCNFKSMQKKTRSPKNNGEMQQLRSFIFATTWPTNRDFLATAYRVLAEKQLFLTVLENRFTNNRGLDGTVYRKVDKNFMRSLKFSTLVLDYPGKTLQQMCVCECRRSAARTLWGRAGGRRMPDLTRATLSMLCLL